MPEAIDYVSPVETAASKVDANSYILRTILKEVQEIRRKVENLEKNQEETGEILEQLAERVEL